MAAYPAIKKAIIIIKNLNLKTKLLNVVSKKISVGLNSFTATSFQERSVKLLLSMLLI